MFNLVSSCAMLRLANCLRGNFALSLSDSITQHCLILLVAAGNFRSHASHFIIHSSWRWNHPPPQCLLCQADTKMRSAVRGKRVLQTFQQMYHWNCGVGRCLCLGGGARWWCLVHDVLCWFSQEFFPASLMILIPGTSQCRVWRRNPLALPEDLSAQNF